MKEFLAGIWEILEVVLIALITVFFIRSFIMQPFLVSGASMEPNFEDGNYLLIDEATYYFRTPQRGEVVVFHYPGDKSSFFIKRIIGLPGERILIESGEVKIAPAGQPEQLKTIDEDYLPENLLTVGHSDVSLGQNEYFVLGDNRSNSFDSRNWGTLSKGEIVGLVRLKIFPFSEFGTVTIPQY